MSPRSARPPAAAAPRASARRRTWAQRAMLALGVVLTTAAASSAVAAAYIGMQWASVDRVDDIDIAAAAAGEPSNYLVVGTDSREGLDPDDPDIGYFEGGGEQGCDCTDTIMVVRVDPEERQVQTLSFPRDLWLTLADGSTGRINSAHAKGEQVLIDTIQETFGIPIHHYVEVDFVGFEQLVDAVGGIPMWFDAPVRDRHTGLSIPESGCRVLDGREARRFVRSRYLEHQDADGEWQSDGTADLGRITRQQVFVRRAVDKAVSQGLTNPVRLNELVTVGVQNVRLDRNIDAGALVGLGRRFADFDSDDLVSFSIPSVPHRTDGGAQVELAQMREAEPLLNVFRGLPPDSISPSAIDLTVLNGTGEEGQAADVAGAFAAIGFVIDEVGDSPNPHERTTVYFGDGGEIAARRAALHITGGAPLQHDPALAPGTVVVVTGTDLTTIHDQPSPDGSADELRSTTTTTADSEPEGEGQEPSTSTTSTTVVGYATGEPPPDVTCG